MADAHRLYAITHSLYSGRARAYLIKQGITFRELSTGHESFKAEVLPQGKLPTIPTLVTPEGEVILEGAAIIEHFEAAKGRPCRPHWPRQQIVSALFDALFGMLDGLAGDPSATGIWVVDCRGAMPDRADWADDIHGTSDGFAKVAGRFQSVLDQALAGA